MSSSNSRLLMALTPADISYILQDGTTFDPKDLLFAKKSGAIWEISHASKPLWIGTGSTMVEQVHHPFRSGDPPKITLLGDFAHRAREIERAAYAWMKERMTGTIMNGIMMTESTIDSMLPRNDPQDQSNYLTCTVKEQECGFFDKDGKLVSPYSIQENVRYKFAIQPTTLWCFRKQVGVKWYVRQVRMETDAFPAIAEEDEWSL